MDKNMEKLVIKHLEEGEMYRNKVDTIEANQKNVIRALATGDNRFEKLEAVLNEIHDKVLIISNTLLGNGRSGIVELVEKNSKSINTITTRCGVREANNEKVKQHEKDIADIKLDVANKKTVLQDIASNKEELMKFKGGLVLMKYIGIGGLLGVVLFVVRQGYLLATVMIH